MHGSSSPLVLRLFAASLVMFPMIATSPSRAADASDVGRTTRGFVLTYIATPQNWKLDNNDKDCPAGYNPTITHYLLQSSHSAFVTSLVGANPMISSLMPTVLYLTRNDQRAGGPRRPTLPLVVKPWLFEEAPTYLVQEGFSRGLNLDGVNAPFSPGSATVRPHKKFLSPTGEYVDNEWYRVLGCYHGFRTKTPYNFGLFEDQAAGERQNGVTTTLIEVTGIKDPLNDDNVSVGVYVSADPIVLDDTKPGTYVEPRVKALRHVSYTVKDDKGPGHVVHGKIVDGVLMTDPGDIKIENAFYEPYPDQAYFLHGARIRLDMKEENPVGILAGYFDLSYAYNLLNAATTMGASHGLSGVAIYEALRAQADGFPDAKTGEYTAISAGFDIEVTPVYIFHSDSAGRPESAQLTQQTGGGR
jgi:hypothetical protein